MRTIAISLVCLVGCYKAHSTPIERLAIAAAVYGWSEAFGAEPDEWRCGIDLVTVMHTSTAGEFKRACTVTPNEAGACLLYTPVRRRSAPRVVLRPGLSRAEVIDGVIHEMMHVFVECELPHTALDMFDAKHTDPRVWEDRGGADSAQAIARDAL